MIMHNRLVAQKKTVPQHWASGTVI